MHDNGTLERINMKLMAKNELPTGAFLKAASELLADTGSGANYLSQWRQNNCDPADVALLNIVVLLQQRTKLLPTPTLSRLEDPERAAAALTALDNGSLREQVANICEAHGLLRWIEAYKELSANT